MAKKEMTMWRKIRIEAGKNTEKIARDLKISEKCVSKYETGSKPMPVYAQIYYLKMRGLEIDLFNAEYLQEVLNERKLFEDLIKKRKVDKIGKRKINSVQD